ncbi:MAG: MFS transporter [Thermosediminibacteraceae bacterium]|nr:MFS transporter [Thermosediminibacteraceae bacterium]
MLETSCFLFEIPTGIVADIRGRKLSVIIGLILMGIALIIEGTIPLFISVVFNQVLLGIGYTFTSGADEAWIADEMEGKDLDSIYLRAAQVIQLFSFAGILVSSLLGYRMINLPIIVSGLLFIALAVFLMFFMKETNFTPSPAKDRNSWGQMRHTFMEGVKFINGKPMLKLVMAISLLYGLYSEGFDRLWTAHFSSDIGFPTALNLKPVVWIGIIDGSAMLLSILAVEYIKRRMEKARELERVFALTLINVFMVISMILFGLSGNFSIALAMYLTFNVLRTTNRPIFSAWINENIKSEVRATVISTYGQIDALGQIIGGPIIGLIALKASIPTAIVVSGIILSPVIVLFLYGVRFTRRKFMVWQ